MSVANDDAPRGFVPMRDYLRLQERCDELEERLRLMSEDSRDDDIANAISIVRWRIGTSPQCAEYAVRSIRSKRVAIHTHEMAELMNLKGDNSHIGVLVYRLNQDVKRAGGPRLIQGRSGAIGGRVVTDAGRAWLRSVCPEIFLREREQAA